MFGKAIQLFYLIVWLVTPALCFGLTSNPLNLLKKSHQVLLVITPNSQSVRAHLWALSCGHVGRCRQAMPDFDVVLGKNGIANDKAFSKLLPGPKLPLKTEGDFKSPAGIFPLTKAFGFISKDKMKHLAMPYHQINSDTYCVDDLNSKFYNQVVDASAVKKKDWKSGEEMHSILLYRYGLIVGYNRLHKSNFGSCIFMHAWRNSLHGTAGCTAMPYDKIKRIVFWLRKDANPILIQLTRKQYKEISSLLKLPVKE